MRGQEIFRVISKSKKLEAALAMTNDRLLILNKNMEVQDVVTFKTLESVVIHRDEHTLIALHSFGKADVLL